MPKQICLIVNPAAGGGRAARLLPDVERTLRGHGLEVHTEATRDLEHARGLALEAATAGETPVTLGGDGLIGAVADALRAHPGATLGVLPGGRGNDLARVLGIPKDAVGACSVIATGTERALDLGEVEDRAFVGIASTGFDDAANRIANQAPSYLGQLVYLYAGLRALGPWRPAQFEVELDPPGRRLSFTGYGVGAANSQAYGGGMYLAPDARLDDGLLDIIVVEHISKPRFVTRLLPRVFKGTHVQLPNVHVLRAAVVKIEADRPFELYADGDPIGRLPARVRALPQAVRVLVPTGAEQVSTAFGAIGEVDAREP